MCVCVSVTTYFSGFTSNHKKTKHYIRYPKYKTFSFGTRLQAPFMIEGLACQNCVCVCVSVRPSQTTFSGFTCNHKKTKHYTTYNNYKTYWLRTYSHENTYEHRNSRKGAKVCAFWAKSDNYWVPFFTIPNSYHPIMCAYIGLGMELSSKIEAKHASITMDETVA